MTLPVSVIVLTYNEEQNIEACLQSVSGLAEEIFVVDSGSTDTTVARARRFTEKIYQHPFEDYARQRNWAQESLPLKNDWVLHLDADERVSAELAAELRRLFAVPVAAAGLLIARRTMFRGVPIVHGGHYPVYHLRLFRKDIGRCENRLYDQHFIVTGESALIKKGDLINSIDPDIAVWMTKHRRWALLEAREMMTATKTFQGSLSSPDPRMVRRWLKYRVYYRLPLFLRPILYFLYRYIFRAGFLDGWQGTIFHFWQGFWYKMLVDREIYRLKRSL